MAQIPEHIQYAKNLIEEAAETKATRLDLGYCGLTDLEKEVPELFELVWLEELVLGNIYWDKKNFIGDRNIGLKNTFRHLPTGLKKLKNLRYLVLSDLELGVVAAVQLAALELPQLTKLNLSENQIGIKGAEAIAKLSKLTSLGLGGNQIGEKGAEAIAKLLNLTWLNLGRNQIGDNGADSIAKLSSLTSLDLSYNQIGDNGAEAISKLSKLTSLDLGENQIGDQGAEAISKLSKLTSLDLGGNIFQSVNQIGDKGAESISKLSKLTSLDLSGNKIGNKGAEAISKLSKLTFLKLEFNKIGDQGASAVTNITQLTELRLKYNQITQAIPLVKMPNLKELFLSGNPIKDIPADIYESGNLDLMRDYVARTERQNKPQPKRRKQKLLEVSVELERTKDVKLVLLGNSNAGKTTLVHYLQTGEFKKERNSTHGLEVIRWEPDTERFPKLKDISVSIWDFGGQEYYHDAYKVFISGNALFLTVWCRESDFNGSRLEKINETKEEELAHFEKEYWLTTVRYYCERDEQSPLLMVQTKTDRNGNERVRLPENLHQQFLVTESFQIGLGEAIENPESKEGRLLNLFAMELQDAILDAADEASIPPEYLIVRRAVLNLKSEEAKIFTKFFNNEQGWMEKQDFGNACSQITNGSLSPENGVNLVDWLDKGGVVTNLKEGTLANRVYLNPAALTTRIYEKMNEEVRKQDGILRLDKADDDSPVFEELLTNLNLIMPHPDTEKKDTFIVPQYLPEKHPVEYMFSLIKEKGWQDSIRVAMPMFYYQKTLNKLMFHFANPKNSESPFFWKHGILFVKDGLKVMIKGLKPEKLTSGQETIEGEEKLNKSGIIQISVQSGEGRRQVIEEIMELIRICQKAKHSDPDGYMAEEAPQLRKAPAKVHRKKSVNYDSWFLVSTNNKDFVDFRKLKQAAEDKQSKIKTISGKEIPIKPFSEIVDVQTQTKRVFLSYSHQNTYWLNRIRVHLSPLKHSEYIEDWTDQEILPGENWDDRIKEEIEKSDIFILLLSADFTNSRYIMRDELPNIKKKMEEKGGHVVYVLTEPFDFEAIPSITEKELIPKQKIAEKNNPRGTVGEQLLAVSLWQNQEEALTEVARNIRILIEGTSGSSESDEA